MFNEWWQSKKKSLVDSFLRKHGQGEIYAFFKVMFESIVINVVEAILGLEVDENRI